MYSSHGGGRASDQFDYSGENYQTIRVDYVDEYFIDIEFTFELSQEEMDGHTIEGTSLYSIFIYEAVKIDEDENQNDITEEVKAAFQFECKKSRIYS